MYTYKYEYDKIEMGRNMSDTFLKWAGGKRWFVKTECDRLPTDFGTYYEPFLGGGSVFFYLQPERAVLSDINQELINTYISVRDDINSVYRNLRIHQNNHSKEYYYKIRERKTRASATAAARMIYLNKACFNGIYRVNKKGEFNVPFGTENRDVNFVREKLIRTSRILRTSEILCQDFQVTIDMAGQNDFIFCDPPYAVENGDGRFVAYTADLFSWNDQVRLAATLARAKDRGTKIIMTNVGHPSLIDLYNQYNGFLIEQTERKCMIAADTTVRRNYNELIITANL